MHQPRRYLLLIWLWLFSIHTSHSQYRLHTEISKPGVKNEISESVFTYHLDDDKLKVTEYKEETYTSLEDFEEVTLRVYYDDQSEILNDKYKALKGIKDKPDRICGHAPSGVYFFSDIKVCVYQFNMRSQGDQALFRYEKLYHDTRYFTRVFFHNQYDVGHNKITFEIPEGVDVDFVEINFEGFDISRMEEAGKVTYEVNDLKAVYKSQDTYIRTLPHILPIVRSYRDDKGQIHDVLPDTKSLYQWYSTLIGDVEEISEPIEVLADSLAAGEGSDLDKISSIYYWVQGHIRYVAFEDGIAAFRPDDPNKVYEKRYADCKGKANLLKGMLEHVGIDARLSWLGTDILPYTYDISSLAVDNHMICTVILESDTLFLDATERFQPIGINSQSIQGKQVMIQDGENYTVTSVPQDANHSSGVSNHLKLTITDGSLEGKGQMSFRGEYKKGLKSLLGIIEKRDEEFLLQGVINSENVEGIQIDSLGTMDRVRNFWMGYSFSDKHKVNQFGKDFYIDIPFFKGLFLMDELDEGAWLQHDLGPRCLMESTISLAIPAGLRVSHAPEDFEIQNPFFSFSRNVDVQEANLKMTYQYQIKEKYLPDSSKSDWNKTLTKLEEYEKQSLILTTSDR